MPPQKNHPRFAARFLAVASALTTAFVAPASFAVEFLFAGDLPGGDSGSRLEVVTGDGLVAGGSSIILTGNIGFSFSAPARYSPAGGLVAQQDLPTVEHGVITAFDATGARAAGSAVLGLLPDGSNGQLQQAVLFDPMGNATILGDLWAGGDGTSVATDMSADGSVVVGFGSTVSPTLLWLLGPIEGFVWTSGTGMVGIGTLPGYSRSAAAGVSADGALVVANATLGITGNAFLYDVALGTRTDLGHLFPGGSSPSTGAIGISADGTTVLGTSSGGGQTRAFRWTAGGGMVDLDPGTAGATEALAMSSDGSFVLGRLDGDPARWDAVHGFRRLVDLPGVASTLPPGFGGYQLADISDDGQIVVGFNASTFGQGFYLDLSPDVPALAMPGALALLASTVACGLVAGRRRS